MSIEFPKLTQLIIKLKKHILKKKINNSTLVNSICFLKIAMDDHGVMHYNSGEGCTDLKLSFLIYSRAC